MRFDVGYSLLIRATFGEMVAGRFVLQSGKRSSENGFQTTFGKRDSQLAIQQITTLSNEILTT